MHCSDLAHFYNILKYTAVYGRHWFWERNGHNMDMQNMFADRVKGIKASAIREIFKLIGQSDIISLAGGNPAPETFPAKELAEISKEILTEKPDVALQYGITDGYAPLRELVHERMKKLGVAGEDDVTIITTGAQQAIDLAMRVLVNDGEGIAVEEPSFIGTLNSARTYRAKASRRTSGYTTARTTC